MRLALDIREKAYVSLIDNMTSNLRLATRTLCCC